MAARVALVATGAAVGLYGGWLLLGLGWDNLVATVPWLVAAVLLHDAVWAPVVLLVAAVGGARLPRPWSTPVMVGAVVLVTVTVAAAPMLGGFGARPDNPTLLDRPYLAGWLTFAAVVGLGVLVGRLLHGRGRRRHGVGDTPGGVD
jgi:hypothetical protein